MVGGRSSQTDVACNHFELLQACSISLGLVISRKRNIGRRQHTETTLPELLLLIGQFMVEHRRTAMESTCASKVHMLDSLVKPGNLLFTRQSTLTPATDPLSEVLLNGEKFAMCQAQAFDELEEEREEPITGRPDNKQQKMVIPVGISSTSSPILSNGTVLPLPCALSRIPSSKVSPRCNCPPILGLPSSCSSKAPVSMRRRQYWLSIIPSVWLSENFDIGSILRGRGL